MDELTFWLLVKVKKDVSGSDGLNETQMKSLPSHKQKMLEMITKESDDNIVDKGEFRCLLGKGASEEEDESVFGTEDCPEINCEGMFDEKIESESESDGDTVVCLDTEENRWAILKKLGNLKHKPFKKNALVDGFVLGKNHLIDVVKMRTNVLSKETQQDCRI